MNNEKAIRILIWGMSENIGGIETFIMNVYRNIDRNKVQFDFLCSHDSPSIAFEEEIVHMGGRIFRIMYSERESIIKSRRGLKDLFKNHPEIKGVHLNANFPYAFPLKYAKKAGIKLRIIHSHNSAGIEKERYGIKKILDKLRKKQITYQINKYPNIYLACSDLAGAYMFKDKPFRWIKNGINISDFQFDENTRKEYRKKLGIDNNTTVIGFIGRYREQKNPLYMLEIFKEYTLINCKSVLVMIGIGEMKDAVDKKIKELRLEQKVIQLGKREDTSNLYKMMDAFLLPSLYEGLPVVLVEAQSSGLDCFVSDTTTKQVNLTELINFCSIKNSPTQWAKLMNQQIKKHKREDYAEQMTNKGFDMKDVAKELEKIYLSVV